MRRNSFDYIRTLAVLEWKYSRNETNPPTLKECVERVLKQLAEVKQ